VWYTSRIGRLYSFHGGFLSFVKVLIFYDACSSSHTGLCQPLILHLSCLISSGGLCFFTMGKALGQGHYQNWVHTWLSPHTGPYSSNCLILGPQLTCLFALPTNMNSICRRSWARISCSDCSNYVYVSSRDDDRFIQKRILTWVCHQEFDHPQVGTYTLGEWTRFRFIGCNS
jgi:hypothetical protein